MATIDVCIPTWPNHPKRLDYLRQIVEAVEGKLEATGHELRLYCSSETETDPKATWHAAELAALCAEHSIPLNWRGIPANTGGNMNASMEMGTGEYIFLQQDDWRLEYPLDLAAGVALMEAHPEVDMVRYNYPLGPTMMPTFTPGPNGWQRIDVRGRWPYGDDPHLRRRSFMDRWGWYYDGGLHGTASANLMQKLVKGNAFIVATDMPYFQHIGYASAVLGDVRAGQARRYE